MIEEQETILSINYILNECKSLLHVQQSMDSTHELLNNLFLNMDAFEIYDKVTSLHEDSNVSNEEDGDKFNSSVDTE